MFRRKLNALCYPEPTEFDSHDEKQFRSVVLWLEEQKIRHYESSERCQLRQLDSCSWPEAFRQYLQLLACPADQSDRDGCLDWLLGRAIRLTYGDKLKNYQNGVAGDHHSSTNGSSSASNSNPLQNLDFSSAEFSSGVSRLAETLAISVHPDTFICLRAVCSLIKTRLNQLQGSEPPSVIQGKAVPIERMLLGFDTGDSVLNDAVRVLRLLYIRDLRSLQTTSNELLVSVQNLTADPRTDTRLGRRGR